jgi:multidrug efflux pump subunit AcrA (membrane-fusion protein)
MLIFWSCLLLNFGCQEEKHGIKAQYNDITEAVYSTVRIEPRDFYSVYPSVSGIIENRNIEEGDTVKKNDVLFQLVNNQSIINSENAKLQFQLAQETFSGDAAILKEIEEFIQSARLKLKNDSLNYEKQKRLWDQNIGTKQQVIERQLAYELAQNELAQLNNSYNRTKTELENKLKSAKNSYRISTITKSDFTIKSSMDGRVYQIHKEIGEAVNPQTALAQIGSADDFVLILLIDEVDISKVYVDQDVVVTLDAYPNKIFQAKVEKIASSMDIRSQTFEVEAAFVNPPDRLFNGLTGEGNIVIQKKKKTLTLPSTYISPEDKVLTDEGWMPIKTGLANLEFTEIISGIDTATVIYKSE